MSDVRNWSQREASMQRHIPFDFFFSSSDRIHIA